MKRQVHFSRKNRQLARLAKELNYAIQHKLEPYAEQLKLKIHLLLKDLAGVISKHQIKTTLGAVAIFFGMGVSNGLSAQDIKFEPAVKNPFNIIATDSSLHFMDFVDLDGDGDLDILAGGLSDDDDSYMSVMTYFENIGTPSSPSFAMGVVDSFGLDSVSVLGIPTLADLDDDGDFDLLRGEYYGLKYYENLGSKSNPVFGAGKEDPFSMRGSEAYFVLPTFVDLDGDGDQDVFTAQYGYDGDFLFFHENVGDKNKPSFAPGDTMPFGLTEMGGLSPEFIDLDKDGDFDLLLGDDDGFVYHENLGDKNNPSFAVGVYNPFDFQARSVSYVSGADLDNDGDVDLFAFSYYGELFYYENVENIGVKELTLESNLYPNPVSDVLNIASETRIAELEITDVSGRVLLKQQYPERQVNLSFLEQGIYLVKLTDVNNASQTQKITKQ